MRTVGSGTQSAIDRQEFTREIILYVYDEADTPVETTIPPEALIELPRVQATLDQVTWRMTAQVIADYIPAGLLIRGRRIVAREWMADGEDMLLFDGHIADASPSKDWSSGVYKETLTIECAGRLTKTLDVSFERYRMGFTGANPDNAVGPSGTAKLTGIVARRRSGSIAKPAGTGIPVDIPAFYLPFFGNATLKDWVDVYDSSNNLLSKSTYSVSRDATSGKFQLTFSSLPSTANFYLDALFVDCWVLINRRLTGWYTDVPNYYILSGTLGVGVYERLNDPGSTEVSAFTSTTDFTVSDPQGIFASGSSTAYESRFVSLWHGGTEYRGKVSSVDKTVGSGTYGRIQLSSAPKDMNGNTISAISVGDRIENTSTQHYQVIDPSYRVPTYAYDGATVTANWQSQLLCECNGGRWYYSRKGWPDTTDKPIHVTPGYAQDLTASAKEWKLYTGVSVIDEPLLAAYNDAIQTLVSNGNPDGVLVAAGLPQSEIVYENTGLYMAPLSRANATAGDLLNQIRSDILPPNFRIFEEVDGSDAWKTYLKYIQQASDPILTLQGIKSVQPREMPAPITRCFVLGGTSEVDRAGQLYTSSTGIANPERLFSKHKEGDTNLATMSGSGDTATGSVTFRIPHCEDGRYPLISKIVVRVSNRVTVDVKGNLGFTTLYLPRSTTLNEARDVITEHTWEGTEFILGDGDGGEQSLIMEFLGANGASIDSIEVYVKEGSYWDARFTDDTTLAPADNGADEFGSVWNRPDPTKNESYRYAPTEWLRRNAAAWTDTIKANRIKTVTADGINQRQARDVGESWCDFSMRSFEFEEITLAYYDPRYQLGDTVERPTEDGTLVNRLIWGINKGPKDMTITAADYSR